MDINERINIAREKLKRDSKLTDNSEIISEEEAVKRALEISERLLARFSDNENK